MALLNSGTLVRTYSLWHMIVAVFLISSPATLENHALTSILGAALRIPSISALSTSSPKLATQTSPFEHTAATTDGAVISSAGLAMAALFLGTLGLADFITEVLPEQAYSTYWSAQTMVRLPIFFLVCAWIYLFKPVEDPFKMGSWGDAGWGGAAKNNLTFTLGFVEVIWLFWMFATLREERAKDAAEKLEKEKKGTKSQ